MSTSEQPPVPQLREPSPADEPRTVVGGAGRGSRLRRRLRNDRRLVPLVLAALVVAGALAFILTAGGDGNGPGQVRTADTNVGRTTDTSRGQQSSPTTKAGEGTGGATAPGGGVAGGAPPGASQAGVGTQAGGTAGAGATGAGPSGTGGQADPGTATAPVGGDPGGTSGSTNPVGGGTGDQVTGTTVPVDEPTGGTTTDTTPPGSGESVALPAEYEQVCALVRLAAGGPAPAGSEMYHPDLDPDGDGLACE